MRAIETPRPRKRRPTGWLARNGRRATVIGVLAAAVVVSATIATFAIRFAPWSGSSPRTDGDALSTGSVLIIPTTGELCRERTIDNSTWRMRDGGLVDCDAALAKSTSSNTSGRWSGSRIDIIRDTFRNGR